MPINKITYAGHSAAFFDTGEITVAIDPWLEGNPSCPASLRNPSKLDLIVLTHGHSDHASDVMRLVKNSKSKVVVAATFELAMILIKEGLPQEQAMPLNKGGGADFKGIRVSLTNAFHSSSYDTDEGPVYAGEPCGVILEDGMNTIYHAGDTCLFSDMQLIKDLYAPNVVLLPIGDRFTMGPKEAAVALKYLQPQIAIPIHYKTFEMLTGTAEELETLCKKQKETEKIRIAALEPGAILEI